MILIADSGSTKTDWCVVENDTSPYTIIKAKGINPVLQSKDEIIKEIATEVLPVLPNAEFNAIHFYGAGCLPNKIPLVREILASHIRVKGNVEVNTDLLGAARALLGSNPGIACIMGTGSNSCFYDGEKIVSNVSPLGYILGDEGSGAALGKSLISDLLKNQLQPELREKFFIQYSFTQADIIDRVYRQPFPNRFLAGFSPFISENINEPGIRALVMESFRSFIKRNVMQYDYKAYPVHVAGSIGYHYKEILVEAAKEMGITIGTIEKSPIKGLINYHTPKKIK